LRKLESASERQSFGLSADAQAWVVVDEEASLLKVKQALREQESSASKSDGSPSPTPPRKQRKNPVTAGASTSKVAAFAVSIASPGRAAASFSKAQQSESGQHMEATRNALDDASTGRAKMQGDDVVSVDSTSPPKDALELLFQLKHSTLADGDTWHQDNPPSSAASSESPSDSDRKLPAKAVPAGGKAQRPEEDLFTMQPMTATAAVADRGAEAKSDIKGTENRQ
jgi:hypothetical protein